ncbi:MAG: dTDP-4-dehydrorhamnose reductase [Deltaproteobacteria bacterium]|nr:dTDP-4-dehydrorhamnose reductase [Deltaproteobacteria bacterium]
MKILICGGDGQLGSDCVQVFQQAHEVFALTLNELDITSSSDVDKVIGKCVPDIILNCAAYTAVDACETEREPAWKVNVEGPKNLASWVAKYGGLLIHISSDYVFDGRKKPPEPYVEDDEPNPLSYYGSTKLEGEVAVMQATDQYIILRTAWLYGIHGRNFLKTILKVALTNPDKKLKVVNDQFGSPTWSYRLALQIAELIEKNCRGTYHATAEGYCSWYELAGHFLDEIGVQHSLIPCTSEEYPTPAIRPRNSILENQRLKKAGINLMKNWSHDVDQFVSMFRGQLIDEAIEAIP